MNRLNSKIEHAYLKWTEDTEHREWLTEFVMFELLAMAIRCKQDEYISTAGSHEMWNGGDKNLRPDRYTYHDKYYEEYIESGIPWDLDVFIAEKNYNLKHKLCENRSQSVKPLTFLKIHIYVYDIHRTRRHGDGRLYQSPELLRWGEQCL